MSIFDKVLDIVKTVVVDSNQIQTERVTRTQGSNKNGTKCNECEILVQSFTDLSKHKKMFHAKINSSSSTTVLARKNLQKTKTHSREVQEIFVCKTCDEEFNKKTELENHMTNNHAYNCLELIKSLSSVVGTEAMANELMESIMEDVIKRSKKIECIHCGKLYQRPHMLKKHIEINHQTEPESRVHIVDMIEDKNNDEKEEKTEDNKEETGKPTTISTCEKREETLVNNSVPRKHISPNDSHTDHQRVANDSNEYKEVFSIEKTLRLKAQEDLEQLEIKHSELKAEKEKLNNEFLLKINDLEKNYNDEMKKHNKTIKLQQSKIILLEKTVKNYVTEVDKQVQLKEKFAEGNILAPCGQYVATSWSIMIYQTSCPLILT